MGFPAITDVGQAIQLALAPVFLLTGIAGVLTVVSGRLSRIVDRDRRLRETRPPIEALSDEQVAEELATLGRRRNFANGAITACTLSALLVCTTVAALFIEVLLDLRVSWIVGVVFTGATFALVIGLGLFLTEIRLATRASRAGR